MNFSTKDVEDELAELENSFDIFGSDAVLEVLEKAIGFECQNLDADEALFILNSVQNFTHFDHSPRKGFKIDDALFPLSGIRKVIALGPTRSSRSDNVRDHYRDGEKVFSEKVFGLKTYIKAQSKIY